MHSSTKNTYLSPKYTENPPQFPSISQPKIIGSFSLDENRQYIADARNCKYVYSKYQSDRVCYDLNEGMEQVIRKPELCTEEKITHLLEFILRNKEKLRNISNVTENRILSTDFVCFRGLLRLIMCSPYERRDPWSILATKYKGTIYLCDLETEKKRTDRMNQTEASKRICSYGFKFEQYILSDSPSKKPTTDEPVKECEEFCCMFSTTLNGQKILYGAEMDGIDSEQPLDLNKIDLNQCKFVELKVKLREQNHKQKQNLFRFKQRNWWCQCFLVNIKKIIVGTRTPDGIVNEISTIDLRDIPKQCQNYWSPSVCMEFCSQFLKLVANEMKGVDSPYDVFRFDFDPTDSEYVFMKSYRNRNEFSFLPEWFVKELDAFGSEISHVDTKMDNIDQA